MEPNNPMPQKEPERLPGDPTRPTYPDLHAEGIDIVTGSGIAEDNEFMRVNNDVQPTETPAPAQTTPVTPPPVPQTFAPVNQPQATPPASSPQPAPAPFSNPKPAPAVTPTPAPRPEKIQPLQEKRPEPVNDPSIKPLRTFKSDAEEAVKYQNVSTIDIAIAEQKKKESQTKIQRESIGTPSPGLFVLFAILIILLIGGGWYYWFISSQDSIERQPVPTSIKTIIPYAKGSTLKLDPNSDTLILIGSKLSASNAGLGNIYTLIPTIEATSTQFAPVAKVFEDTNIPSRLERSLAPEYMIGTYTYDSNSPFIILKNTFFQNAFSGMLEWEKDMRIDLLPLIQVTHPEQMIHSTSTSFTDAIVSNIDTRVLKDPSGEIILAYAFADKDTIVISTNTIALKYILDRILTVRTIQ